MDSDLGKKLESDKKNIMSFKLTTDLEKWFKTRLELTGISEPYCRTTKA